MQLKKLFTARYAASINHRVPSPSLISINRHRFSIKRVDEKQIQLQIPLKTLDDVPGFWEEEQTHQLISTHVFDQFSFWERSQAACDPPNTGLMKVFTNGLQMIAVLDIDLARRVYTMELNGLAERRFSPWMDRLLAGGVEESIAIWKVKMQDSESHRRWRGHHKKAFTFKVVEEYIHHIENSNNALVARFSDAHKNGKMLDVVEECKHWSWYSALKIFLSPELLALLEPDMEKVVEFYNIWKVGLMVIELDESPGGPLDNAYQAHYKLMRIFDKVLGKAQSMVENNEIDEASLIFKMISSDGKYWWEDYEFGGILLTNMMFAAHDSLGIACNNLLYDIWDNTEEVEKLRELLLQLEPEDQMFCPELIYFVKESLRIHPSHIPFMRFTIKDDVELGGYSFPIGTVFTVPQGFYHMNEKFWDQPLVFNPSRYESKNSDKNNQRAWITFNFGNHECLGNHLVQLELKSIVRKIICEGWKLNIEVTGEYLNYPNNHRSLNGNMHQEK